MISLLVLIITIVALAISAVVIFIGKAMTSRKAAKQDRFNWWLPFFAVVGTLILFVPVLIYGDDTDVLYVIFAVPIVSITLLVVALVHAIRMKGLQGLAILSMLFVFWITSWGLLKNALEVRSDARWLLFSKQYKARVLAEPVRSNGEMRHIEWDGWGWVGIDTTVYLVFDPNDSLSAAAKSHSPGKFSGIPCEIYRVRRLESHYYTVHFYTETDWGHCQ
jgi:hypothetical protein